MKGTYSEQVSVAGHDELRFASNRALQNAVVVRIVMHYGKTYLRCHNRGVSRKCLASLTHSRLRHAELPEQLFFQFVEQDIGCYELEAAKKRKIEKRFRETTKQKTGDKDIRVSDNASH